MAITFMDGFDLYASTTQMLRRGWVNESANFSLQTGRFAGQCVRCESSASGRIMQPITSDDTISFGFAMRCRGVSSNNVNGTDHIQLRNSGSVIARIGITSAGHVRIGRGDYTTNLIAGSVSGLIVTDDWNYLEVEFTRNASTGAVNIYLNGTLIASASGANTGASSINEIAFTSSGTENVEFDDMYFTDTATKVGECKIETIRPSADTATKDFTRSTGADNFALVDETLVNDDTDYNSSSTVGHKDLFDLANLGATPLSVKAVQLILTARKDNTDARTVRTNMKNGSTTTNGTTRTLSTSYGMWGQIYELNPDDSAAFDGTDVNAMQLGYEVVS